MKANMSIKEIAQELNITQDRLYYLISIDSKLINEKEQHSARAHNKKICQNQDRHYFEDLPNEE